MGRRAGTLDPVLAELRAELRQRLPLMPSIPPRDLDRRHLSRVFVAHDACLRVGVLRVGGTITDIGAGGLFFYSNVLVEAGEHGTIDLGDGVVVAVRIAWIRGSAHPLGQGMGMAFELRTADEERRAIEAVLTLLDDADHETLDESAEAARA